MADDWKTKRLSTVAIPKNWNIGRAAKLVTKSHEHPLPLCKGDSHGNPSQCVGLGLETICRKKTKWNKALEPIGEVAECFHVEILVEYKGP